jgi:dCMP deaminase
VKDNVIISTGYNGPPRGVPHCGERRLDEESDGLLFNEIMQWRKTHPRATATEIRAGCPRQILGYKSGEGLHLCPAVHAETNCLASAARVGAETKDTTLYMNCIIPCKSCLGLLMNAGVKEIVIESFEAYDSLVEEFILPHTDVRVRTFET